MTSERAKTLEALQVAIKMEIDGKELYRQAAAGSRNEAGRKLLQSLAEEEDVHRHKLEEIYKAVNANKTWPATGFEPDRVMKLSAAFAGTCRMTSANVPGVATEFDAINIAIQKEKESYDFYECRAQEATYQLERDFYEKVAAEERGHELVLVDYAEYLTDPAAWFVKTEHPSLDGG